MTVRAIPREPVYAAVIALGLAIFRALGLRREVRGAHRLPAEGTAVLAITHFGYLDFALTEWAVWRGTHRRVRFLVTSKAYEHPVAGPLLRGMRHIPVDRHAGTGAYRQAVQALRSGELVGVFPEGMVSPSWTVRSLKTGAVRMAAETGVPLVPVVVWGGHRVLTKGHRFSVRDAWRAPIVISVGEPLRPRPGDNAVEGTARLRAVLEDLLLQAQRTYPDRPSPTARPWWLPAHLGGSAPAPDRTSPDTPS